MNYRVTALYLAADSGGLGPQNKMSFRAGQPDRAKMRDEPEHQRVYVEWSAPNPVEVRKELVHRWYVPYGQLRYMEIEPIEEKK